MTGIRLRLFRQNQDPSGSRRERLRTRQTSLIGPGPRGDVWFVDPVFVRVVHALNLLIAELLLGMATDLLEFRNPIDSVNRQAEAVDLIFYRQLQRGVYISLLLVATYMQAFMVLAAISEPMDKPRVSMEIENHRLVL